MYNIFKFSFYRNYLSKVLNRNIEFVAYSKIINFRLINK